MRIRSMWILSLLSVAALAVSSPQSRPQASSRGSHEGGMLVSFDTMYGVDGPFIGDAFAIRGIPGDELPWEVREAKGKLDSDGHLTIKIKGLVFKDEAEVPPELRGINDETEFRGLVSCWTEVGNQVTTVNVVTAGFPATRSGDSSIRATVNLPNPCVAPIVLVLAGSENKWFAVTGVETEE